LRILKLRNPFKGRHGLWPDERWKLFQWLPHDVAMSIHTFTLGVFKLQHMVEGMFSAVALSKPPCRLVANGWASMLGVRRGARPLLHQHASHRCAPRVSAGLRRGLARYGRGGRHRARHAAASCLRMGRPVRGRTSRPTHRPG